MSSAYQPGRSAPAPSSQEDEGDLPGDLAFLRAYGMASAGLREAARLARRQGVEGHAALIATGATTDTCYHYSLSCHLGVPFLRGSPPLAQPVDVREAITAGRVRLADGTVLVAPRGRTLRLLLAARAAGIVPSGIVLAPPSSLEALVVQRAGPSIARFASHALPVLAPSLCARGGLDRRAVGVIAAAIVSCTAAYFVWPAQVATIVGALFFAAMVFRLLICAAGRVRSAIDRDPPCDADLPTYSVLVPLHDEADMVDELVQVLSGLDYPAAKLEILILVEANDGATRHALARAALSSAMRVVVVPDGFPRTKPRALNVGLVLARGELLTVYDAEDRPKPGQLRAAAARYAAADDRLACLQAVLAISSRGSLLERLFACEYRVLFGPLATGLARFELPIPLGGTSNHFRGMGQQTPKTMPSRKSLILLFFVFSQEMIDHRSRQFLHLSGRQALRFH